MITDKDQLIVAVGNAMEHYISDFDAAWYIDYTTQDVVMVEDYAFQHNVDDAEAKWAQEMIEMAHTHRLERIDNPSDEVRRQVMMNFAESQPTRNLVGHLSFSIIQQQEFASFENVVQELRLEKSWKTFRKDEYQRIAKKWIKKKRFDFVDGQLVRRTD